MDGQGVPHVISFVPTGEGEAINNDGSPVHLHVPRLTKTVGYVAFFIFGLTCFWTVSSIFVELPGFLDRGVPEGKEIANDLNVVITSGGGIIVLYVLCPRHWKPASGVLVGVIVVGNVVATVRSLNLLATG